MEASRSSGTGAGGSRGRGSRGTPGAGEPGRPQSATRRTASRAGGGGDGGDARARSRTAAAARDNAGLDAAGVTGFFRELSERLRESATVTTVYGEPVVAEGKTVIPVARVAYGFGGGSGVRPGPNGDAPHEGGGGGGGVMAAPAGALEITPEGTRFVAFDTWRRAAVAAAVAFTLGYLAGRR